ncbi:MAG: prealbumin-like fold domain-containing protein [Patescibacteria group bacterium]|nr:prealbumin-like fold domain-containing protein [Patescibacteria group bacterium]
MRKNLLRVFITLFLFSSLITIPKVMAEARDYDTNAIIYGGAYSIDELNQKINFGSGPNAGAGVYGSWQAPGDVKYFYNGLGIFQDQFLGLGDGFVHSNGTVTLAGKNVATDVLSAGREFMPGSTQDTRFAATIWWRSPSISFASSSIPAFIYLDEDGNFAYAIIKSCGNPVMKWPLYFEKKKVIPKFKIVIHKFEDLNANNQKEDNENPMKDIEFTLEGNGIKLTKKTDANGIIEFTDLIEGNYALKETPISGWQAIGDIKINISGQDTLVFIGNRRLPKPVEKKTIEVKEKTVFVPKTEVVEKKVEVPVVKTQTLPVTGAPETFASFSLLSLGTSALYYIKSRKLLKK